MRQVLHIHGGETFKNYEMYFEYLKKYKLDLKKFEAREKDWVKHLQEDLGSDYQVIRPVMPNPRNAKYVEWKIWLEKLQLINNNTTPLYKAILHSSER